MNSDQFKAFLEGTMRNEKHSHFCVDLIAFINTLEVSEKAKLFDRLAKLIDQKDSENIWQKLRLYDKDCLAFIQHILISSLKNDTYENSFDKLHHHCKMLCEDALKNGFVGQLTIKEWQKANAWALKKGIQIKQFPKEVLEFDQIRENPTEVIRLLKRLCNQQTYWKEISNKIKPILKEISLEDICFYATEDINAFNVFDDSTYAYAYTRNSFSDTSLALVEALEGEKLEAFLKISTDRLHFGKNFLHFIADKTYQFSNQMEVKELISATFTRIKANGILERFKLTRRNKHVSEILKEALGTNEKNSVFEYLAEEITEKEIQDYVFQTNDCFKLAEFIYLPHNEYDPLTGLFKSLNNAKLKVFLEEASKRKDLNYRFFERILTLIHKMDDPKKTELFALVNECVNKIEKYQDTLPAELVTYDQSHVAFATHCIADALKSEEGLMPYYLDVLYKKNPLLFSGLIEKGLQPLVSPEQEIKVKEWFNAKRAKEPQALSALATQKEVLDSFEMCRKDPHQLKAFLRLDQESINSQKFQINFKYVADVITEEEILLYATKENNCFGINIRRNNKILELLFQIFDDEKKLRALISSIIRRDDLDNGVYLNLVIYSNNSALKNSLLSFILQTLEQQNKWDDFLNDLQSYNDGKGNQGTFLPAVKELMTLYLKEGWNHGKDEIEKRLTKHLIWSFLVLQGGFCQTLNQEQKVQMKLILDKIGFKDLTKYPGLT